MQHHPWHRRPWCDHAVSVAQTELPGHYLLQSARYARAVCYMGLQMHQTPFLAILCARLVWAQSAGSSAAPMRDGAGAAPRAYGDGAGYGALYAGAGIVVPGKDAPRTGLCAFPRQR